MIDPLQTMLIVLSLALAAVALGYVVLNRAVDSWLIGGLAVLELGLLVQCVVGIVQLVSGDRDVAAATFVGYLLFALVVLPAAAIWSLGDRSRGGTAVTVVAALVVPVLVLRLTQIWNATVG